MLGKNLVSFIKANSLMDVETQTEWSGCLTWSVFLDDEKHLEIEYNWNYNGEHTIYYIDWSNYDANDINSFPQKKGISQLCAMTLRKKCGKI